MTRIVVVLAIVAALAPVAAADTPPAATEKTPEKTAQRPPHRAVPDYDGREPEGTTAGDVLLWVPRVVLFPVRIVADYVVRRPFGWLVQKAEHSRGVRRALRYLFRHVENANPLIFPVALVDFGFQPSVGLRVLFRRGYLVPKSDVTLRLGTGGFDWWRADVGIKSKLGPLRTNAEVGANNRPDNVFYGIGGDAPRAAQARYEAQRLFARGSIGAHLSEVGDALLTFGVTDHELSPSTFNDDLTIEQQVAAGRIVAIPPGYQMDVRTARIGGHVTLDTRFDGRRARSGARFDGAIERVVDLSSDAAWTRVELMVGGGLLLDPVHERKLDIRLAVELVEPDDPDTRIPFFELATITGGTELRGLSPGRLFGQSAAALLVDYQFPLAAWIDAHAHVGAGNVFEEELSGFSLGRLRGSFGGALTLAGLSDRQIGGSLYFGTEPLGDGIDVSSYRLILEYSSDY